MSRSSPKVLTEEEKAEMVKLYPKMHNRDIAEKFGISAESVKRRCLSAGAKKDAAWLCELRRKVGLGNKNSLKKQEEEMLMTLEKAMKPGRELTVHGYQDVETYRHHRVVTHHISDVHIGARLTK
jgi:hypothetical protein